MSHRRPTVACLLLILLYKPFMWCRSDARLRHAFCCRPFEASLQTPDRCIFISILGLHIHVLYEQPACVQHGFWFHDWRCDHRIFQSMIIVCYIIPVFIMFASTFKVLTGLSLAIVLARFLAWRGALRCQPWNPRNGDNSLAKIGVNLVSCSCGKWSPMATDEPQTASAINH